MIYAGDKVIRDTATQNQGKVQLGEAAPMFRPIRSATKSSATPPPKTTARSARRLRPGVPRPFVPATRSSCDTATTNQGKVRLGDCAPVSVRHSLRRQSGP